MSVRKIIVIGPESTGKSTLSAALAATLHTVWVPEYARAYCAALQQPYEEKDLLAIAKGQIESENKAEKQATNLLICDTDLYVLKVWSEHSFGRVHPFILETIAARRYDLYLLTDIDLPWENDPLREHGTPDERRYFYNQYKDIVSNSGLPWAAIGGNHETRVQQALQAIKMIQKH